MKTIITFVQESFRGNKRTADPVNDFFKGSAENKRAVYEQALRGAQADQLKVLERVRAL